MDLGGSSTPYASSVTTRRENDAERGAPLSTISRITENDDEFGINATCRLVFIRPVESFYQLICQLIKNRVVEQTYKDNAYYIKYSDRCFNLRK